MLEQEKLFFDAQNQGIHMYAEHNVSVDEWMRTYHSLHSAPAGAILRLCFKDQTGNVLGCMMWGRPTSRKIDQGKILELTRMCFLENTPRFIESKCLGMARKHIRKHYSQIKGLIAYSSLGAGHEGIVYQVDNWYPLGGSKGENWENRDGRINRDLSPKIRWTRSP